MALQTYRKKRDFHKTPEPRGGPARRTATGDSYVIQKHAARRMHHDFRLEIDGVLKSWAVPKGPPLERGQQALAVETEDHPIEYGGFEGVIPKGEYGGGTVMLYDRGRWEPEGDARKSVRDGKLTFRLVGERLRGRWSLVRMSDRDGSKREWLLIKRSDADGDRSAVASGPDRSVASGRTMEEIAADADRVWSSRVGEIAPEKSEGAGRRAKTVRTAPVAKATNATKAASPANAKAAKKSSASARVRTRSAATAALDPGALAGAKRAPMPATLRPQLATLVRAAPDGDDWLHEIKYDGYRLIALKRGTKARDVRLLTRSGQDWTERFPTVRDAVANLAVERAVLDGEVVVLRPDGVSSFQALQSSLTAHGAAEHVYFCFDLPYCGDYDLCGAELLARKTLLARVLAVGGPAGPIRYSGHVVGRGPAFHRSACEHDLEGIVSKRIDARYQSRRTATWVKVKCLHRQEFVIGGASPPEGSREHFGSLLLGVYDGDDLIYAGKVGTGFSQQTLRDISARLAKVATARPPFVNPPSGREARGVRWARPALVGEVAFTEWTADGILRHPVFHGLREDRDPKTVRREQAADSTGGAPMSTNDGRSAKPRGKSKRKKAATVARATVRKTPRLGARAAKPAASSAPPVQASASKTPAKRATGTKGVVREMATTHGTKPGRAVTSSARAKAGAPIAVAGVRLTNPDRVLYPQDGITKRDVAEYYVAIADWILPHVVARPLTLLRCPEGVEHQCFYQRHVHESTGPPIRDVPVEEESGEVRYYLAIDDLEGLLTLVQGKALELHAWGARADSIERPDRIVLDLDPGPNVEWSRVVATAHALRDRLEQLELQSFARTTGGKGLHVVVPIEPRSTWDEAKQFARLLAGAIARADPGAYVLTATKAKRPGKIYLDYLRNARAASAIASYSTRARPGAPIATPVRWNEVEPSLDPMRFTLRTVPRRLRTLRADPWKGFFDVRQTLARALRTLARSAG